MRRTLHHSMKTKPPALKVIRMTNVGRRIRGFRQIGPLLQQASGEPLTMQAAYDTDVETGVRWMNEALSKELNEKFPTVVAMAGMIEQERDKYRREAKRLKKLMSRIEQRYQQLQHNQQT